MSLIGTGQKTALLEAFAAAVALLLQSLQSGLVLVGGTSLLSLGGNRSTEDVDIAVTAPAIHAFFAAAIHDSQFMKDSMDTWEYTASNCIIFPSEFLSQGGGFVPVITVAKEIVAGVG